MKKILDTIILAISLTACSDNITLPPALSLFSPTPEVYEEEAIFRLASANIPDNTERIFPVTFSGTAERGTDYEVSADAFVLGGESPVDSIVVTTLKFGTGKTVTMNMELPEGIEAGKYLSSGYIIQDIPAYVTMDCSYKILADSVYVRFGLMDKDGNLKALRKDTEISLEIDADNSTAVPGEDFEFADSTHFTIRAGESQGELKLKQLKAVPEEGRDRIALSIIHEDKFGKGTVSEMTLDLADPLWNRLGGTWKIHSLDTDAAYMEAYWGEQCTGYDLLPQFNQGDRISFDLDFSSFKPDFNSSFKDYFIGESAFMKGPGRTILLNNTNRYFSKGEKSEDKLSYIGLNITESLDNAPDTLTLRLIDHTSRSFMPELESTGKYSSEKPVATAPGQHLILNFVK